MKELVLYCLLFLLFSPIVIAQDFDREKVLDQIECAKLEKQDCLLLLDSLSNVLPSNEKLILAKLNRKKSFLLYDLRKYEEAYASCRISTEQFLAIDSFLDYAALMGDLAYMYADNGDLTNAEKKALELKNNLLSRNLYSRDYKASTTQLIGNIYEMQERHEDALEERLDCLKTNEEIHDANSIWLAYSNSNLAYTYIALGDKDSAEKHLIKGHDLLKMHSDSLAPAFILDVFNVGVFYQKFKEHGKALEFFERAYNNSIEIADTTSVDFTYYTQSYSDCLSLNGHYQKAMMIGLKNPVLKSNTKNPKVIQLLQLRSLAKTAYMQKDYALTEEYSEELLKKIIRFYRYNTEVFTQENLMNSFASINAIIKEAIQFNADYNSERLTVLINDMILMQKGYGLERELRLNKLGDLKSSVLYKEWGSKKKELNKSYTTDDTSYSKKLELEIEQLNKEMLVNGMGQAISNDWTTTADIQAKLKEDEIAIEFIHIDRITDLATSENTSGDKRYFAVITHKDKLSLVRLFKESTISKLFNSFDKRAAYVNQLYSVASRGAVVKGEGVTLEELILKPLKPHLENVKTIYYSPSGLLHRINLSAIPIDEETVLSDVYDIHLLGSTRKIAESNSQSIANNHIMMIGDLDFGEIGGDETLARGGGAHSWSKLNHTGKEIEYLSSTAMEQGYDTVLYSGTEATEHKVKSTLKNVSPQILHFATHGFFLDKNMRGDQASIFHSISNPMMRSGLLLSDANFGWVGLNKGEEDNVLTAAEVSELDLKETELVVLSACETGLGDINNLEGVFGLQRAFKVAGAKYIIMSLWQVPDRHTTIFMKDFYDNLFEGAMSVQEAFRSTQRTMKDRFLDTYNWAGFVLIE